MTTNLPLVGKLNWNPLRRRQQCFVVASNQSKSSFLRAFSRLVNKGTDTTVQNEARSPHRHRAPQINPGSDLLSHTVTRAVPSAVEGLTTVFGMGTGVTPLL